ncbi:MAG: D-amino-acid transaminase [Ectobacillus sp.]
MNHEPIVLFQGEFIDTREKQPAIMLEERGLQFGDGVYEVIRLYHGAFHLLEPHLARFYRSMEEIEITPPFSKAELVKWLYELVEKNDFSKTGMVYLQISRGVEPRNHIYSSHTVPTLYAYVVERERPVAWLTDGIRACTEQDIRWLRCDIKSLNLLPNTLARTSAERKHCKEALFVRSGIVTEGSLSNFFLVKNGTLYTHPADHLILNGIIRQYVLSLCAKLQIPVQEELFGVRDVQTADECFFTGTTIEILPMTHLDGAAINDGNPGPITRKLQQAFQDSIPHSEKWSRLA